jgi:hypothetical protein
MRVGSEMEKAGQRALRRSRPFAKKARRCLA